MDRANQTALLGFGGIKHTARHAPFQRCLRAHQTRQEPARGGLGHDPAPRKNKAIARRVACQPNIHRQLHGRANTHCNAIASRNQRLLAVIQPQGQTSAAIAHSVVGQIINLSRIAKNMAAGLRGQIRASTKGPVAAASKDNRFNAVIGIGNIHCRDKLIHHRAGKGVHLLRPVERDGCDTVVYVEDDLRKVWHLRCSHKFVLAVISDAKEKGGTMAAPSYSCLA